MYNSLYDLAAYPECIQDLRDEINSVLKEHDGVMSSQALFQMKLMDSFLLESQRHNPVQMSKSHHSPPAPSSEPLIMTSHLPKTARFQRFVQQPVTLQDGTLLPAGVIIEAPHIAVTQDPELYPNPEVLSLITLSQTVRQAC